MAVGVRIVLGAVVVGLVPVDADLRVEAEQLEQFPRIPGDDVLAALVAEDDHGQAGGVGAVVEPPERVEGAAAGGLREGNQAAGELGVVRPARHQAGHVAVLRQLEAVGVVLVSDPVLEFLEQVEFRDRRVLRGHRVSWW
ncbi:hypothetical protein KJK32_01495 [Streptomyces sp. JCM17656]|nr:hypothetical protein KJK32_01495 [Streptomyces sp. JCM17656]